MSKNTFVTQLQIDAADPEIALSTLLRKTKVLASKLELNELLTWVDSELNGYTCAYDDLPDYRQSSGVPSALDHYHGWQPVGFETVEMRKLFSRAPIMQGIGSLEKLLKDEKNSTLTMHHTPEQKQIFMNALKGCVDYKVQISVSVIHSILDTVRNMILDWALKLEKIGITGENFSFSQKEKEEAKPITKQIIYAQNIGHIGNAQDQAQISNTTHNYNGDSVVNIINEIQKTIQFLPVAEQEPVQNQINQINEEFKKPTKEQDISKISGALNSIKKICEGAMGNLVAQGIISLISAHLG